MMMTMLAQAENVPSESFKNAALIALALLGGLYYIVEIAARLKKWSQGNKTEVQQPLEIRAAANYVPKDEFKEHAEWDAGEHEKIWNEVKEVERKAAAALDAKIGEVRNDHTTGRSQLHIRVDQILAAVSTLGGKVEMLIQKMK